MAPTNKDLERYRDHDVGADQWVVKKAFLKRNWDSFPEESRQKLITLAHCFHNIHVWGCSYPPKVMAEVKRLSEGLTTSKPKAARKPKFVKINFVPATTLSNTFSVLDAEEEEEEEDGGEKEDDDNDDDNVEEDDLGARLPGGPAQRKGSRKKSARSRRKPAKKTNVAETSEMETDVTVLSNDGNKGNDGDEDDEVDDFPRCGFGFDSAARSSRDASTSSFVFGKKDDYAKRLGFVRSAEINEGFQFGMPIPEAKRPALESGQFRFGIDAASSPAGGKPLAGQFSFGHNVHTEPAKASSEDLQQQFESTSLRENGGRAKSSASSCDATAVAAAAAAADVSETLARLDAARNALRKVRPPLAQSRIEFLMLQVGLNTQSKVQVEKNARQTSLLYDGVVIASGPNEPAAYEGLRNKILSAEAWHIVSRGAQRFLELGPPSSSQKSLTANRKAKTATTTTTTTLETNAAPTAASFAELSWRTTTTTAAAAANASRNSGSTIQNAHAKRLTPSAQSEIKRNLDAVRRIFHAQNFKAKVEMLGGFERDPTSTLNMAFQMASLKPVRDADIASPSCRFHFAAAPSGRCMCVLKVHGVYVTEAVAGSNREAKQMAARSFLATLRSRQNLTISHTNGENRLVAFGDAQWADARASDVQTNSHAPVLTSGKRSKLDGLFLVKSAAGELDLASVLNRSSRANEFAPPVFTYAHDDHDGGGGGEVCRLQMSGVEQSLEFEGRGETKAVAKDNAIREALNTLIASCPTIVVSAISQDASEFLKETMPLGTESLSVTEGLNRHISQDNVGFQLLERMGWTGGSLDGGSGLIEPIMLRDNSGNSGLGYAKSDKPDKRFTANIYSTLRAFLREADVFQELKFSPTFSNVERKHIHCIARQFGLKSKSTNRPEGRVLCISHSIDWNMVLDSLKREGGTLGKFRLLPPGSWSLPEEKAL